MAGRFGFHFFGGGARVDQIAGDAFVHQQNFLARNSFSIEGRAGLQRVVGVIVERDVFAQNALAHALVET